MSNIFLRNELYFGKDIQEKISSLKVAVVGLGGVGGYAIEALARLGVNNFVIIDKDEVDETNINRQIIALHSTIGKEKTSVVKQRILDINPSINIKEYNTFLNKENMNIILDEKCDYVVDAIDTLTSKWELIKVCLDNNIKFISSLGMGNKEDLTKLELTTLDKTSYDPLAKKLREIAKKDNYIKQMKNINVVFSREIPQKQNIVINEETNVSKERIPPSSIIFVPSTAGFLCAYFIYKDIIKRVASIKN